MWPFENETIPEFDNIDIVSTFFIHEIMKKHIVKHIMKHIVKHITEYIFKNDKFLTNVRLKRGFKALEKFGWLNSEEPRTILIRK